MAVPPTPLSLKKGKEGEVYPLKNKRYPLKYVVEGMLAFHGLKHKIESYKFNHGNANVTITI